MPSNYKAITEHNEEQLGKDTSSRKTQVSMYSDPTHFIYEILQNADDYGATEVLFKLSEDDIVIEHNGVPFKEENVKAITYFGKSTSREDLVKTGRFGIGFKSVFAFTATPIIISGSENFQIYGLYRVKEYPYPEGFPRSRTRIILPFNHESQQPDFVEELMSNEEAYQQISECLVGLDMNTLLFTRNIREIHWEVAEQSGCYSREDEIDDHSRLTTIKDGKHENTYFVFSKIPTWENEEHKPVEIAFAVDTEHQLSPIADDTLHVLFPTRERTGLRFILNGPYRTNPARETISLTDPFNIHLMEDTCELMKESLSKLRDRKLLTLQFLSILPNEEDPLSSFYSSLRDIIVNEFRDKELTPTRRPDVYAAASGLYREQSEAGLSRLIQDEDLAVLLGKDDLLPLWVANLPPRRRNERGQYVQDENIRRQNERISDFLTMLGIVEWTTENFVEALSVQSDSVLEWLKEKQDEWHQQLYVLLGDFLSGAPAYPTYVARERESELSQLNIVRCSDGEYRIGSECHFPSDDVGPARDLLAGATGFVEGIQLTHNEEDEHKENFHYVVKGVYSSGRSNDNEKVHKFLEDIGVRKVDETERIKLILKERYKDQIKPRDEDMEKFIALVEDEPEKKSLFKDYFIFEVDLERDNKRWFSKPSQVFVDSPYLDTGLTVYHSALEEDSDFFKHPLSPNYAKSGIDLKRFGEFAAAVGTQTKLKIIVRKVLPEHPEYEDLVLKAPGQLRSDTCTSEDYTIAEFRILLEAPSVDKSKLIWQTMTDTLSAYHLKARYSKNRSQPDRVRASSLVHELRSAKWVPQKNGDSFFFVRPKDASVTLLPDGFSYKVGQEWIDAIEFGKTAKEQREEYTQQDQQARGEGFVSLEEKEQFVEFAQRLREEGRSINDVISQYSSQNREAKPNFPTSLVKNPELRKERVLEQISNAPEKAYEERERRERHTKREIDQRTSLIEWYTNDSGEMICQICKEEMPFKKTDDEYYFLAVEALTIRFKDDELPENHFPKEYEAQYLALCPECAARYNYFVREVKEGVKIMEELRNQLINSDNLEVPVRLGELETDIRFVEAHLHDLKEVLHYSSDSYDSEGSVD